MKSEKHTSKSYLQAAFHIQYLPARFELFMGFKEDIHSRYNNSVYDPYPAGSRRTTSKPTPYLRHPLVGDTRDDVEVHHHPDAAAIT